MVIDLPFVSIFMVMLLFVGGAMVLVPLVLFAVFAGLALRRNKELREVLHDRSNQDNKKYDYVTEVISGIQTVKAFAMEPQMQRRFERLQQSVAESPKNSIILGGKAQTAAVLYGNIAQITVVAIGAHHGHPWLALDGRAGLLHTCSPARSCNPCCAASRCGASLNPCRSAVRRSG